MTPAEFVLRGLAALALATSAGVGRAGSNAGEAAAATSERRPILDALRPAVEAQLGAPVEFHVHRLTIEGGWAFVVADPRRKGGAAIDGWAVFGEHYGNMDGLRVDAVLRRQPAGWTLVDHAIGATDVWYCEVGPRAIKKGHGC